MSKLFNYLIDFPPLPGRDASRRDEKTLLTGVWHQNKVPIFLSPGKQKELIRPTETKPPSSSTNISLKVHLHDVNINKNITSEAVAVDLSGRHGIDTKTNKYNDIIMQRNKDAWIHDYDTVRNNKKDVWGDDCDTDRNNIKDAWGDDCNNDGK